MPTRLILEHLNISRYFKNAYSLDSSIPNFANKASLVKSILKEEDLSKNETIMVGDGEHDLQAAMESNLEFYYAHYGFGSLKVSKGILLKPSDLINYLNL
jgi:phosphoglycolate phosphatase-like HAD superfamily hydrolase